ncbi:hypothetical protein DBV05_g4033 [Lasiodiplodia theobromae]|uniref:C2H2-type domain-containing protein n=1 Tax=Lasiodiplodia theobromae TaxID=45133 RepID=A0A5N5DIS1_9PEZI|nr:hypothetical protein DBV05_g4033 [Lasiodiplodia theobromae]
MSSSPAQKPGSPAGKELLDKGMRKFKMINRIIQYEDALIKPGEDALDLRHRTQYRRRNTTRNPTATPRLHASRRAGTSISSDYSATSYASNGSNSSTSGSSNSSSSSASLARRTDALRIQHSDLDCSTRQQSRYRSDANTSAPGNLYARYIFHGSDENVSETTPVPEAAAIASTAITSPHPGIDHAAPSLKPLFITGPPPGSPQIIPHDPIASMLPPSVIRSDTAPLPTHQSFDPTFYSIPRSTASSVVAMSRESSSQGVAGGNNDTRSSLYENNNENPDNDTIDEQSEPDSSVPSNDHQPTPPSDDDHHQDTDDASSEHDDSDAPSDDSRYSPDPLQRDFLEEILRPVKQHLFQRLMVYIANSTSLGLPLPAASLYGCAGTVKTEAPEPPTSLPIMQREVRKRAASQASDDKAILAAAPKEAPASTDQGLSTSRANGKRPSVTTNGCTGRMFMGASRKRKMGNAGSPGDNDDSDDDDDDERRRPRKPRRSPSPHEHHEGRRIACPYFKRNPRSPAKADACFRTGFRDITKMKHISREHLERVHDCSIQCPRCYKVFKTQDDVNTHLRRPEDQMCARVQERPLTDGYNAAQAGMLRGRMRNRPLEEKWKYIWRILFPADQDDEIPPPWWMDRDEIQGMNFYARYENFMRNDLPRRVEQGVIALVDRLFLSETLQGRVETIVQNCLEQSYSHFRAFESDDQEMVPRQHETGPPAAGVPAPAASALAGPSTATQNTQNLAVPHMAGPASIDPSLTLFDTATNNFQPGSWQAPQAGSTPAFRAQGLPQGQPVAAPQVGHAIPHPLATYGPMQPGNAHDLTNSYLTVEHDVSAAHSPVGRSPDSGHWTNIDFSADFDDLGSAYHTSFHGGK